MELDDLLFIVEGKTDKRRLLEVLPSAVNIICTNGYIDEEALLDLLEPYEMYDFVTLFDADDNGDFYRKVMNRIYPEALQLEIPPICKEVAETPAPILKSILQKHKIKVNER